ncbi:ABC transporter ATP-binding protein [Nakamurella endophytica]|uniref:ABC transporter ATP-binding protein n=1 Tax=Nakamurella endophytica TaxID=1748367 RepID=A0A917SW98_9ACTN|nr:ABC transporter ATP-binding protein [Nakamurella endophytica]GGL99733.1 ABC transporter ATP-binding protein [Nakamurella endophytica]
MTATEAPLLEVRGVVKTFPAGGLLHRRVVHAVDGVDLHVRRGEVLSLVGESGSGKSTLGRCIAGMSAPDSGSILFDGQDVAALDRAGRVEFRRRVQPVFQDPRASLDPRWPIARTIAEPLVANGMGAAAARDARVAELMSLVGLPRHLADRRPRELSGGQQQRVAIAAALALEPELLVADEPVSALDVSVQAQILNLLAELRERLGLALLFIAHDLGVVEYLSDRVAVMYLGRVVETGTVDDIFEQPQHPYTRALIDAIPHPDPQRRMTTARLAGEIPSPIAPPSGCHYHTRCPWAVDRCSVERPGQTPFGPTHEAACFVAAEHPFPPRTSVTLQKGTL